MLDREAKRQLTKGNAPTPSRPVSTPPAESRRKSDATAETQTSDRAQLSFSGASTAGGPLGNGQPLESLTRSRMERGFGHNFGNVRLHTDSDADRFNQLHSARAITVGTHIAFAAGEYRPQTITGEGLLAHELAHVIQQTRGSNGTTEAAPHDSRRGALENEAELAAHSVVRSVWGSHRGVVGQIRLTSAPPGLRLQRCSSSKESVAPKQTPQDEMKLLLKEVLEDNQIVPGEWQKLKERSQKFGLVEGSVQDLAKDAVGISSDLAYQIGALAVRKGPAFDTVRSSYVATYQPGDQSLSPSPIPVLLSAALADADLDFDELDGLRALALRGTPNYGDLQTALVAAKVSPAAVAGLIKAIDIGVMAWKSLAVDPVALPLKFVVDAQGLLAPTGDLNVVLIRALTGDGAWTNQEFPHVRALLQPLGRPAAARLLVASGFENDTADRLAQQFTSADAAYAQRMPQDIRFKRDGTKFTIETSLFVVPPKIAGATPVILKYVGEGVPLGDFNFKSGVTAPADSQRVEVLGKTLPMVRPSREEDLFPLRAGAIIKVNEGLGLVPTQHIALIKKIVVDPGEVKDVAADAGYDGLVTMYFGTASRGGVEESQRVMIHEVGHLVSFKAASSSPSFWSNWREAAKQDDIAVSLYGTTNQFEDFAEAYLIFIVNRSAAKAQLPHRSAIIEALINPPSTPVPVPTKP